MPSEIYASSEQLIGKKVRIIWKITQKKLKEITAVIDRTEGKTLEEEGGGRVYGVIDKNSAEQIYSNRNFCQSSLS